MLGIFLISLVTSANQKDEIPSLGLARQGDSIELILSCENSTYMNLTKIQYPNLTTAETNVATTKDGSIFNYTFSKTSAIGQYNVFLSCDINNKVLPFMAKFDVNETGFSIDGNQATIYVILIITNLLLLGIFVFFSVKIPYQNKKEMTKDGPAVIKVTKSKYAKLIFIMFSIGLFMWFITLIAGMVNNYIHFTPLKEMAISVYTWSYVLVYVSFISLSLLIFFNIWHDIVLNKTIIREGKAFLNRL